MSSGKETFVVGPDAVAAQRTASDPTISAWVSANAGAGKTKVLTDRVIRLMLAGTAPARILCLTFTKAAAAEMTIRVFETLGNWVTLDDVSLSDALLKLTGEKPKPAILAKARRLFARAVETPGGLKIETIHAFCERLLHLVPFEANVPARFNVLDDAEAAELMAEARGVVLLAAVGSPGLDDALDTVTSEASGDLLTMLLAEAVAHPLLPERGDIPAAIEALRMVLELGPGDTPVLLRRAMAEDGIPPEEWPAVAATLEAVGGKTNLDLASALRVAARATDALGRAEAYRAGFFTATDRTKPVSRLTTKAVPQALRDRLSEEQTRLVAIQSRLFTAESLARTAALYRLAGAVKSNYEAIKRRLGALDFADLIDRTLRLLESGAAAWVLYRLDRGIDHVLVDEAQDTNQAQWRILRKLTEDFTAGAGRPSRTIRTIFAVGDPKQSIYSFQGADPRLFEEGRVHWRSLHGQAGMRFVDIRLALSFRSAPTILKSVDGTFKTTSFEQGETGTTHESARPDAPGRVEIWPTVFPGDKGEDPDAWSLPVDILDPASPALTAARRVAQAVRHWTTHPDPQIGRPWRPGEILVLARRRGPAFFAVIRALKAQGVQVAGADRIDINRQIAVNDLVSAGQAALLVGHDLALAEALKSPLIGLDDDDLVRIAADRPDGCSLEAALAEATDPAARAAYATLQEWRRLAHRHGPFGFYATLLGPGGGRKRLVERLGGEAQDAIDTFLCRAQAEERNIQAPSLTAFLARFEASEHVIKRDPESRSDEVRVMTVHGAKGLEAPLVILIDGCEVGGRDPKLIAVPAGRDDIRLPVWASRQAEDPVPVARARAELRARALEEHNRLLYVALTRARDRLVIVPFTGLKTEPEQAWGMTVRRGFEVSEIVLETAEMPYGPVEFLSQGAAEDSAPSRPASGRSVSVPDWLARSAPPEPEPAPPLRPSSALGAADRIRANRPAPVERARRRGILVHALLEHLGDRAEAERVAAADRFVAARAGALDPAEREAIAQQALAVTSHPSLADLFGPDARGEVAVAGTIGPEGRERAVSGQIDRLFIGEGRIVLADFKTGRPPKGAAPAHHVAQVAVYAALLRQMHPGHALDALLVWPEGPFVLPLSEAALAAALDEVLADTRVAVEGRTGDLALP